MFSTGWIKNTIDTIELNILPSYDDKTFFYETYNFMKNNKSITKCVSQYDYKKCNDEINYIRHGKEKDNCSWGFDKNVCYPKFEYTETRKKLNEQFPIKPAILSNLTDLKNNKDNTDYIVPIILSNNITNKIIYNVPFIISSNKTANNISLYILCNSDKNNQKINIKSMLSLKVFYNKKPYYFSESNNRFSNYYNSLEGITYLNIIFPNDILPTGIIGSINYIDIYFEGEKTATFSEIGTHEELL